ncbi:MAG TPA: endolytic transglycosylase MltG [Sphingobacteriaceae bacterium]|nr:endolytic transglycosylase MltG [Sphingobacteriaceae bacterium]
MAEVMRERRLRRQKGRRRLALTVAGTLLAVAFIFLGTGLYWYEANLQPVAPGSGEEQLITIPPGAHSRRIAELLHEHGLIKDPLVFRMLVRFQDLDGRLQAGQYSLGPGLSLQEIVDKLASGDVALYSVTVPEGLTVAQTIALLAEGGVATREELAAAVAEAAQGWPFLPDGPARLHQPLEGYLFPDTYRLPYDAGAADMVAMMLRRFEEVFSPAWRERARELGLTVHEVVTLASIVEREAQVPEERPVIAAVFHNRLRIGMKLDADPTVIYAVAWDREATDPYILTRSELRTDSPYNTYVYGGLPPGPIASPGAAAIEAVLYPANVDYLYFVSKFDGTGAHVFARTYQEHLRNVAKYRDGR